jgi:hypothetical protein
VSQKRDLHLTAVGLSLKLLEDVRATIARWD